MIDDKKAEELAAMLDGCGSGKKGGDMLDSVTDYAVSDLKLKTSAAIKQWADADIPLGEGETQADRLEALLIGVVDANKNGEIDDDEADAFDIVCNFAIDYLTRHGVEEEDAINLLTDFDEDLADTVRDLLIDSLPDDDAAGDDMDSFAFLDKANNNEMDIDKGKQPYLDAAYKKTTVIRNGKKERVNKRISGTVRLSGAQKAAIRKAQMKSHSAGAMMRRAKSMANRVKMGIKSLFGKK